MGTGGQTPGRTRFNGQQASRPRHTAPDTNAPSDRQGRTLGGWTRLILRRWPVVVAFVLLGLALGAGYTLTQPILFSADSTLVLSPESGVLDPANSQDLPAVANTVASLAVSDSVLLDAQRRYIAADPADADRAAVDLDWMRAHVVAAVPTGTSLVRITGLDDTPEGASDLTAATNQSLIAQVQGLRDDPEAVGGLRLATIGEPTGQGQVSPTLTRNLILGGNLGLILGVIVAGLLSDRGLRLRDSSDVARTLGVSEVMLLPVSPSRGAAQRFSMSTLTVRPGDPGEEPYRLLRARLNGTTADGRTTLAVLGPVSPTILRESAVRLGAQLCAAGSTTVVVEADFHGRPWHFDDGAPSGLGEVLAGDEESRHIRHVPVPIQLSGDERSHVASAELAILPAGDPPLDPAAALVSARWADLLERLRVYYEHVIVVGPSAEWQSESVTVAQRTALTMLALGSAISVDQAREITNSMEADPDKLLAIVIADERTR